jgi:hypothetical protein
LLKQPILFFASRSRSSIMPACLYDTLACQIGNKDNQGADEQQQHRRYANNNLD